MQVVALTGNIASGKSTVAKALRDRGATLIDADTLAREVVERGTPALATIVERFGPEILTADGTLDRAAMRTRVFNDPDARRALEAIVHPAVEQARQARLAVARARGDRLVICDIPLLFEAGLADRFDRIILVDAPDTVRLERLVRDRGLSPGQARAIMATQLPSGPKRACAHWVVDNSGDLDALARRVDTLWRELVEWAKLPPAH
ncbi:MAG: dephospho-CoA kinase [Gemmatimonadaceae bacterium]|jgi:dephospho-CoA kinase|nr:dephospho-CoA kinase [Gemmatimonadaceae bacterium]